MRARYRGYQSMRTQQVQQSREVGRAPALLGHGLDARPKQHGLDIPVPEAVDVMFATPYRPEQFLLRQAEQTQAPTTTRAQTSRLVDAVEDLRAGLRPIHDGQSTEVAFVTGLRHFGIAVEVGDSLVHGTPSHLATPSTLDPAADLKRAWVVDDRLEAQHLAELVVHLQPVVLDPVFDPGPRPAILLAVGQHLAVEARVQATTQKRQDVLGRQV